MNNVFDYLNWRDDVLFYELNEIDALIFNRLAYFPLENIIDKGEIISIEKAYLRSLKFNLKYSVNNDKILFEKLSKSIRYKDLKISNVVSKNDTSLEEQFMAITILLPDDYVFISFRGSTDEVISWKEDFNMSFKSVKAQEDACLYLNNVSLDKKIYVSGHSKGGNLAMYSSMKSNNRIKSNIIKVYNFDGPGFINLDNDYKNISNKIISYIPEDSIVGRLFNLNNKTIVVKSSSNGISQHNLYSWCVEKNKFITGKLSSESNYIKNTIDEWLSKVDLDSRCEFVNTIYNVFKDSGVYNIRDINILELRKVILSYKKISGDTKKLLSDILGYLFDSTKNNIKLDISL